MAAAVIRATHWNGAGADNNIDAGASGSTPKWGKDDTTISTTAITIPSSTGSNYSWYKMLALYVTTAGTTNVTNRKIYYDASTPVSMPTGLKFFFKQIAKASYVQATDANRPADVGTVNGSDPTTPSTYTAMSTTAQTYDSASEATSTGNSRNGGFAQTILGVASTYTGGANSALSLPNLHLVYDEA